MDKKQFLEAIDNLNVWKKGSRRAPHKPLLLLYAFGRLLDGESSLPFADVEKALADLLDAYAPPVKGRHEPALPYWHLRSDGLWQVAGADTMALQKGKFPVMGELRTSSGGLKPTVIQALQGDPTIIEEAGQRLLDEHFPESLHEDIRQAVGLGTASVEPRPRRKRDPQFRRNILRAYEHRCVVSGFRAALGGTFFGVEAAHVKWHAQGGPDTVDNGLVLEPTLHKLFDRGAWSLTDDLRVIVSSEFTGSAEAVEMLRARHGQPIRHPLKGHPSPRPEFVRWHREASLGGVFRTPALSL